MGEVRRLTREEEKYGNKRPINLHENILRSLKASPFRKPNKLQLTALPYFAYCHEPSLVICGPARSGKTVCAIIGIVDLLCKSLQNYSAAILLAPTYEIAEVTFNYAQIIAQFCPVSLHFIAGGKVPSKASKNSKEVFVGTPEKTANFCRSNSVDLKKVGYLLVDEADCLSNPKTYFKDTGRILKHLAPRCRVVVCTSSMTSFIREFLKEHVMSYEMIEVENEGNINAKQLFLVCDDQEKINALLHLLTMKQYKGKTVILCERKDVAASLSATLVGRDLAADIVSGEMTISQRKNVLEKFKEGVLEILISTRSFVNVIDAPRVTKLINYDQVLDEKYRIDTHAYKKRQCVLSTTSDVLAVNFIEKRWKSHVFKTKDLIDTRTFYTGIEVIDYGQLETYF